MLRNSNFLVVLFLACCFAEIGLSSEMTRSAKSRILSRKRRYVTFPEGSSFSVSPHNTFYSFRIL